MDVARLQHASRPDATPEGELNALAAVLRFLLLEKGDAHDLTNEIVARAEGVKDKKGQERHVRS